LANRVRFKPPSGAVGKNSHEFGEPVLAESNTGTPLETTIQPLVEKAEDVFLPVSNENHGEIPCALQVIEDVLVLELVYFIKDHDVVRAVVRTEAVKEFIAGCGLPVDIECFVDAVEDPVQGFESAVVLPTIDVLVTEINDVLAELVDGVAGDAGLPCARRTVEKRRCRATVTRVEWAERIGEVTHLSIPVFDLSRNEFLLQHPSICDHKCRHLASIIKGSV
jgi:hypothetical protein